MRKLLLLSVCSAICSFGAQMCATNDNVLGQNYSCSYQGLTFSNFSMTSSGNVSYTPAMDLTGFGVNQYGEVFLNFNPNMFVAGSNDPNTSNHLDGYFFFTVSADSGMITGIDLGNAGTNTAITETACSARFGTDNLCSGNTLGQLTAVNSGSTYSPSHVFMTFAQQANPIYVFKDINLVSQGTTGAGLSLFSQSFAMEGGTGGPGGSPVPEPYSFFSVGGGLIAVALFLKRKTAAQ